MKTAKRLFYPRRKPEMLRKRVAGHGQIVYLYLMDSRAYNLLQNLNVLPELGRQRCFELGNPFYFKHSADKNEPGNEDRSYYRKELPTGEVYLVKMHVTSGEGFYQISDTVIRQIR